MDLKVGDRIVSTVSQRVGEIVHVEASGVLVKFRESSAATRFDLATAHKYRNEWLRLRDQG